MTRNTRRMIERLDPFSLPQEGQRPFALTGPKPEDRGDAADSPHMPPPRRRKRKTSRPKRPGRE